MICNIYKQVRASLPLTKSYIEKIIKQTATTLQLKNSFEFTLLVVSDKKIQSLNKKFRQLDKITDVLSFSQLEGPGIILPQTANKYLGDIVICLDQVKRQAKIYDHSLKFEFSLLLIHGFLHLLGYKDKTEAQYKKMKVIEDKILHKYYGQD